MAISLVASVWILSFVVHIPSIVGWNLLHVPATKPHKYCRVPYEYNAEFTMSASVIEFFIPLVLLISLNMGIYIKLARRRNSKKLRRSLSSSESHCVYGRKLSLDSSNNNGSDEKYDIVASLPMKGDSRRNTLTVSALLRLNKERPDLSLAAYRFLSVHRNSNSSLGRLSTEYSSMLSSFQKLPDLRSVSRASISSQKKKLRKHDDMVRDFLLRQDNKALLSLALLVITFVVCWTPSILCDILYSFCPTTIPLWLLQLAYWILALSSSLNPFLYGIGSNDFRRMAKSWLCTKPSDRRILESMLYNHFIPQCELVGMRDNSELGDQQRRVSYNVSNNASFV
ncbi:G-protein coupled receptor 1 [Mactra antiquata]